MSARVLVAYAGNTGFTSQLAAEVAGDIASVGGLEVDVRPMTGVPTIEPYVAVYLGWPAHSRAGRVETERFLSRNAGLLAGRRIWVVHRQPGVESADGTKGMVRLSRLLVRHGAAPQPFVPAPAGPAVAAPRSA
ncbi:MAG: hypothetical protein ACT4P1_12515 [Sporichthyaceae bacterium]